MAFLVCDLSDVVLRQLAECFNCVRFFHVPFGKTVARSRMEMSLLLHQCFRIRAFTAASLPPDFLKILNLGVPLANTSLVSHYTPFFVTRTILAPFSHLLCGAFHSNLRVVGVFLYILGWITCILGQLIEKINLCSRFFVHAKASLRWFTLTWICSLLDFHFLLAFRSILQMRNWATSDRAFIGHVIVLACADLHQLLLFFYISSQWESLRTLTRLFIEVWTS